MMTRVKVTVAAAAASLMAVTGCNGSASDSPTTSAATSTVATADIETTATSGPASGTPTSAGTATGGTGTLAPPTSTSPTASTSVTTSAPSSTTTGVAPPKAAPSSLNEVITEYLRLRENRIAADYETPQSWLDDVEPLITEDGFPALEKLSEGWAKAEQNDWEIAHAGDGYAIDVKVSDCGIHPAAGVDTADHKIIQCALTDRVLRASDESPLPTTELDLRFTLTGTRPPPLLELRKVGKDWKVAADITGLAS